MSVRVVINHNLFYVRESRDNPQQGTTAKENKETRVNNLLLPALTVQFNKYYTRQIVKA